MEEEISILPKTKWMDIVPKYATCEQELINNALVVAAVPQIHDVIDDVNAKVSELKWSLKKKGLPMPGGDGDDNGLFAIVAYTHDNMTGVKNGNLYYELNNALRKRSGTDRQTMMATWGPFVHFLMKGLLPVVGGVCNRGYP